MGIYPEPQKSSTLGADDDLRPLTQRLAVPRLAYAPAEVATVVGLSRSKVMQLIAEGTIPSVKIDRSRRVLHTDLVAWLDGLKRN